MRRIERLVHSEDETDRTQRRLSSDRAAMGSASNMSDDECLNTDKETEP